MVQNAALILENEQCTARESLEIVPIYLLFS